MSTPMDFLVATDAQAHEIALVIRATDRQRLSVMHQRCHCRLAQTKASLAERMAANVAVTDFSPSAAISLMLIVLR